MLIIPSDANKFCHPDAHLIVEVLRIWMNHQPLYAFCVLHLNYGHCANSFFLILSLWYRQSLIKISLTWNNIVLNASWRTLKV